MGPKRVMEKGKVPMVGAEHESHRLVTRSRGTGGVIRETQEVEQRPRGGPEIHPHHEGQTVKESERAAEFVSQGMPIVEEEAQAVPERATTETQGASTAQPEMMVGGHGATRPSGTAAPIMTYAVTQPQLMDVMQMMVGTICDMHQDMGHFMEARSQPHVATNPAPSIASRARALDLVRRRVEDAEEVEVVDVSH